MPSLGNHVPHVTPISRLLDTPLCTVGPGNHYGLFPHFSFDAHVDFLPAIVRDLDAADCIPISGGNELPLLVLAPVVRKSDDAPSGKTSNANET